MQIRHDILKVTGAHTYCREPYKIKISRSAIEAFVNEQPIVCHHRNAEPFTGFETKALKKMNMYYDRPADELKIVSLCEHNTIHHTHKSVSNDTRQKLSKAKRGKVYSDFGRKFTEHFGIASSCDRKLYIREHKFYRHHNKTCRWELQNI